MKKKGAGGGQNFNPDIKDISVFEAELDIFLKEKCPASYISVDDVKDIVWNEKEDTLVSKMAFVMSDQNPKTSVNDIMQFLSTAWNYFPHRRMNGLSPKDMSERIASGDDDPEYRPDFYELFAETFPETTSLVKRGETDWEWEFSADYESIRSTLSGIKEEMNDLMADAEEADADGMDVSEDDILVFKIDFAKKILEDDPIQFEAATILAQDEWARGKPKQALGILEGTIKAGRVLIPPEFESGNGKMMWGFLNNRPFLFCLGEYATMVERVHGPGKAIPLYEELISLNPSDNQGIRSFLATAYLKTNNLEKLLGLKGQYPEDLMPGVTVGALLALYKLGRLEEARKQIKSTKKYFSHVFGEILKTDHPQPELTAGRVTVGGEDEAWLYWRDQGTFWMASGGAIEFLQGEMK
jgi:tetratricopeptide (TPR) repeat protein